MNSVFIEFTFGCVLLNTGGGGGWNGTSHNVTQASGVSFLQGGRGGSGCALAHLDADWRTQGGFGGGGGGCTSGGGGGGYTGTHFWCVSVIRFLEFNKKGELVASQGQL